MQGRQLYRVWHKLLPFLYELVFDTKSFHHKATSMYGYDLAIKILKSGRDVCQTLYFLLDNDSCLYF